MMRRTRRILIGIVIVIIAGAGVFLFEQKAPATNDELALQTDIGTTVPDSVLKDIDGRDIALSSFLGKPVVVSFWASWCSLCKDRLLDFAVIQREFSEKVAILAINRAEKFEQVREITQELGIGPPLSILLDSGDTLYRALAGFSMPETLFIDKDGVIQEHHRGSMTREELRRRVQDTFHL